MKNAPIKIHKAEKYSFLLKEIRREEAVSEVVGTILILAITVVLFAAIFFYVQQFPLANPSQQVTVYPEISYNPASGILYENITLKAGKHSPKERYVSHCCHKQQRIFNLYNKFKSSKPVQQFVHLP